MGFSIRFYGISSASVALKKLLHFLKKGDIISIGTGINFFGGGDHLNHKEYIRIVDGASAAVLFVHGIVGTPDHFDRFIALVPDCVTVYNMLLDGHGKGVRDFSHTSMQKWVEQVREAVDTLSLTHESLYVVAHSMGTLFAIEEAVRCRKILGLFLLAAPLKLSVKPRMLRNSFKVYRGHIRVDDHEAMAAQACYGIGSDKNPLHYFGWIPRYFELFAKIKEIRGIVDQLPAPCSVYQSFHDEMVSRRAAELLEGNPLVSVKWLKNSGHYYYTEEDFSFLMRDFKTFVDGIERD